MPALAADIETPSGTFRFDPPLGYTELSAQEIDAKFGRNGRKPIKAFGNASRASTVSVTWSQQKLTQAELPKFKQAMEELLPRLTPGLVFNDRQLRTIGARQWIYLDSTVPAVDTSIHHTQGLGQSPGPFLFPMSATLLVRVLLCLRLACGSLQSVPLQDQWPARAGSSSICAEGQSLGG